MKFIIAVNEEEEKPDGTKGTVTFDHVETGSLCARTNRRKLHSYLTARGVPKNELKRTMKLLGFTKDVLGATVQERKDVAQHRAFKKAMKGIPNEGYETTP
jgi:hypothetical protein